MPAFFKQIVCNGVSDFVKMLHFISKSSKDVKIMNGIIGRGRISSKKQEGEKTCLFAVQSFKFQIYQVLVSFVSI